MHAGRFPCDLFSLGIDHQSSPQPLSVYRTKDGVGVTSHLQPTELLHTGVPSAVKCYEMYLTGAFIFIFSAYPPPPPPHPPILNIYFLIYLFCNLLSSRVPAKHHDIVLVYSDCIYLFSRSLVLGSFSSFSKPKGSLTCFVVAGQGWSSMISGNHHDEEEPRGSSTSY